MTTQPGFVFQSQIGQPNGVEPAGAAKSAIAAHESGTKHPLATSTTTGMMSAADKAKLDGVATQATKNALDSELRDRNTHTGTQAISTIAGLQTALDSKQNLHPLFAWNSLTLLNAWINSSGTARYIRLITGQVQLEGLLDKNSKPTSGEVITTLPATPINYRPSQNLRFYLNDSSSNSFPYIEIYASTGQLVYGNIGTIPSKPTGLSLSTISFYAS